MTFRGAEGADELAMPDIAATLENRKTRLVADAVDLPVIASGGAGSLEHFIQDQARRRA